MGMGGGKRDLIIFKLASRKKFTMIQSRPATKLSWKKIRHARIYIFETKKKSAKEADMLSYLVLKKCIKRCIQPSPLEVRRFSFKGFLM